MTLSFEDDMVAHFSALRFVIEVILANNYLATTPEQEASFIAEMKLVARRTTLVGDCDDMDAAMAIALRSTEIIGIVLDGAAERAASGRT